MTKYFLFNEISSNKLKKLRLNFNTLEKVHERKFKEDQDYKEKN